MERGESEFNKIGEDGGVLEDYVKVFKIAMETGDCSQNINADTAINNWLKAHQTALLEAVLEELKGVDDNWNGCQEHYANVEEAIQDIQTIINKAIGV